MWVKIDVISDISEKIYLPYTIAESLGSDAIVRFSKRAVSTGVEFIGENSNIEVSSFNDPIKILMTSELVEHLQIPTSLVYQLKVDEKGIELGPVIGLLLGDNTHIYGPYHMRKYVDRFGTINKIGGLIYAFSPKAINWEEGSAHGIYYDYRKSSWEYGCFPLPAVIYRRDFHISRDEVQKLIDYTDNKLFNSLRFSKHFLYKYLSKDKELSSHLPATALSDNYQQVKEFIDEYNGVILKPIGLSRGRGICIINKKGGAYKIDDYRDKNPKKLAIKSETGLEKFFNENSMFFRNYLIQELIPLAKVDQSLFDIRIVMQKDENRNWVNSGIECRVAGKKNLVTNISRGGYALTIDETLKGAFHEGDNEELKDELNDLCIRICKRFDDMGYHFAEFGIDIGIDVNKKLWIIETNVFPSFKGFKAMDHETYLKIRYTPILYAAALAGFSKGE